MSHREQERRERQREQALSPAEQRAVSIPNGGRLRRRVDTAGLRWRRKALAEYWNVSDRTIDRMRVDGRLGEPVGYVGRLPIWSDEQRLAAERGGNAVRPRPAASKQSATAV